MVKHVKLFENWAEENVELPEYMDPNVISIPDEHDSNMKRKTMYSPGIINKCRVDKKLDLGCMNQDSVNFTSFSDYDFWRDKYDSIEIIQKGCKYKLTDLKGIPPCDIFTADNNHVKTFKNVEGRTFSTRFGLMKSKIENLKYIPDSNEYLFYENPLLSYWGLRRDHTPHQWEIVLCEQLCYRKKYPGMTSYSRRDLLNISFHSEAFCYFSNDSYNTPQFQYKISSPWVNIYEDPYEVENYDFLFVPFYIDSENFRECTKSHLPNANLSGITIGRSDLW